jgi:hypothetical protein
VGSHDVPGMPQPVGVGVGVVPGTLTVSWDKVLWDVVWLVE